MKSILVIILIFSFTAISVLGLQMMLNHNLEHNGPNCLASKILLSKNCLDAKNPFLFASFHLKALKNFILSNNFLLEIFSIFIFNFLFLTYFSDFLRENFKIIPGFYCNGKNREKFFVISEKEYIDWLALYESRDKRPRVRVA